MKILLISPRYLPIFNKNNEGAIEKLEQIYLRYNAKLDDKITVYSPKIAKDNFDNKIIKNASFRVIDETATLYKISKFMHAIKRRIYKSSNNESYIRLISKDIIRKKEQDAYDLIIFENGEQDIPIFKKLTKTNSRIALHLHNDYVNKNIKNSKNIIDSCSEIWTVSNFIANQISDVGETNITVIPNTISEVKPADSIICNKLKQAYGIEDKIVFVYVGRLLESKGILQLLKAYNKYSKKKPDSMLLIIGKTESSKRGQMLQEAIEKIARSNSQIRLVGYVRPEDLPNYLEISDCQIIPSICNEAFGLVVLEAMRSGLQIIASRVGGIPEIGKRSIKYIEPKNIENDLLDQMNRVRKTKKIDYSEILSSYTNELYCDNIYKAIHKELR